ncbi:hypothetical protein JHW43_008035 [Diplocarpon mali]|nr:hypothetical protein JHW43_008035 [Diplocarpon mali]
MKVKVKVKARARVRRRARASLDRFHRRVLGVRVLGFFYCPLPAPLGGDASDVTDLGMSSQIAKAILVGRENGIAGRILERPRVGDGQGRVVARRRRRRRRFSVIESRVSMRLSPARRTELMLCERSRPGEKPHIDRRQETAGERFCGRRDPDPGPGPMHTLPAPPKPQKHDAGDG